MARKFQGQRKAAQQATGQSRRKRSQKMDSQSGEANSTGPENSQSAIASQQNLQLDPVSHEYIRSDLIKTVIFAAIAFVILILLSIVL